MPERAPAQSVIKLHTFGWFHVDSALPTILIADDREEIRALVRETFEANGHAVIEAADGLQALTLIEECRPAVVLLDIEMPVMDGLTVLSRLRSDSRLSAVPVVAFTAHLSSSDDADRERILQADFDCFLSKPVNLNVLRQTVADLLKTGRRPASS